MAGNQDQHPNAPNFSISKNLPVAWNFQRNLKMAEGCLLQLSANWNQYYDKFYNTFNSNWCVSCSTILSSTKLWYVLEKTYLSACCCRCQHSHLHWMLVNLLSVPLVLSFTRFLLLKGHRHDWGQCLFTKIIWHYPVNSNRFLTESHPKLYKPFWKGLSNKQSWNHPLKSLFVNIGTSPFCL